MSDKVSVKTALSRILFAMYLVCVAFVCFASSGSLPHLQVTIFNIPTDKIVHFLMFMPFPIFFYLAFDHKKSGFWPSLGWVVITIAVGAAVAAGTEFIQKFSTARTADIYDFYSDMAAVLLSSIIVLILDNGGRRR